MTDVLTSDGHSIHDIVARMADAWNRGDADAWVEPFADDAAFVTIFGQEFPDRETNRREHAEILQGVFKGSRIEAVIHRLHFVRPDVAVLALDVRLHVPDDGGTRLRRTRLLHVLERHVGDWRIVASQNTDIAEGH